MSSLLKRCTPPTCTLKIFTNQSPLIPRLSKPSTANLSFELHIDDPRLPNSQHLTLQGNYQQLQSLGVTIEEYLQRFLCSTPSARANLLQHHLYCDLAPEGKIQVNISQLFDLANVIHQCNREIEQIKPKIPKIPLIMGISLASFFILLKLFSLPSPDKTATDTLVTATEEVESTTTDEEILVRVTVPLPDFSETPQPQLPTTAKELENIQPPAQVKLPLVDNPPTTSGDAPPLDYQPLPPISIPPSVPLPETPSIASEITSETSVSSTQEVQAYFQQRWQPPAELKEKLEYRLIFDSQGRIEEMIPIGTLSQYYLFRVQPPRQVKIISEPLKTAETLEIRLILTPQGLVQTFAEQS